MPRVWEAPLYLFNYALDEVVAAFHDRYPNSHATHVISEDVLAMEVTSDQIITRKLIVKKGGSLLSNRVLNQTTQMDVLRGWIPQVSAGMGSEESTCTIYAHVGRVSLRQAQPDLYYLYTKRLLYARDAYGREECLCSSEGDPTRFVSNEKNAGRV